MAKDGTRRGGARAGAGRKKKQKPESPEKIIQAADLSDARENFPQFNRVLYGAQGGHALTDAEDVYYSVYAFARENGADKRLPKELVELFAVTYCRWTQAETEITANGFTSPHPTTGADCKSPLVEVSNLYSKQAQNYWYSIWSIVKDGEADTAGDEMEGLLS